jgi:mono/diheme cytochrome c family protein
MSRKCLVFVFVLISATALAAAVSADWLIEVPDRDRQKVNPYHDQPQAIQAGRWLFADHCAQCHGETAEGMKKCPSLRTPRVQSQATEGDLHWLLTNGNLRRGMPSWSKLPDQQLWQLISYLRSLKTVELAPKHSR